LAELGTQVWDEGDEHFQPTRCRVSNLNAGVMYTEVQDGLASEYLNTNNIDPTSGVRFRF
jgi:hypothetical protein